MSTRFTDIAGSILIPGIIPTGNLLWVDAVNGNDSLAVRGRMSVAFKTLTAAKNAALAGDTIMVLPGTYNENKLLKHLVNWHFLPGAIVSFTKEESGAIFDTSAVTGNCASVITGMGEFKIANGQSTGHAINLTGSNAGTNLVIDAKLMSAGAACVKTTNTAGALSLNVRETISSGSNDVIAIEGSASNNIIHARELYTSSGSGLFVNAGAVVLSVHKIYCTADVAVDIQGGASGERIVVRAFEIFSQASYGVHYNTTSGVLLHILGARIKSASTNSSLGNAVKISSASSYKVRLHNCILLGHTEDVDYSIASVSSVVVQMLGCVGNLPKESTVTALGGTFINDTDID